MTRILRGHFDGKVIVPETPVDLPRNSRLTIVIEDETSTETAQHGTAASLAGVLQQHRLSDDEAELMRSAIEEGCERIDGDPDINFDQVHP